MDAFLGEEAAGGVKESDAREFGDGVHEPGAAEPDGSGIVNHLESESLVGDGDDLDGA